MNGRGTIGIAAVALVGLGSLLPVSAASASRSGTGDLSARLAQLAKPALQAKPATVQAQRLSLAARGPGSLVREGGRVVTEVRFDRGAAASVEGLRRVGAKVLHVSRRYQTLTVAVKPKDLRDLSAVPRVASVTEVLAPILAATECTGLVTSEGDAQLNASSARTAFNVDGSGVTVGILSDSFDRSASALTHAATDVASGDLPGPGNRCGRGTPVSLLDDSDGGGIDEGRAMAQIVHDLAPGAGLSFASATALNSQIAFASGIRNLWHAGADVIVDDVIYFDEPFFQEGPVAVAVNEATAAGTAYFSAAGNNNLIKGGRNITSWEAPAFRDAATATPVQPCPAGLPGFAKSCMDFDPESASTDPDFAITVEGGKTLRLVLQWAQPWGGVSTDLDAYLLDATNAVLAKSENENSSTQRPFEALVWKNTGPTQSVRLAINRCDITECDVTGGDTGTPRLKFVLIQGSGVAETEYEESAGEDVVGPTSFGHSAAASAVGVGAVRFNDSSKPEDFSSRGPVTHYFGPVTGTSAAAPIVPTPISKPDLVATDGGANTFFGQNLAGVWRFFGTSAAAPHAAAVAALMRQANPFLSLPQLRLALAATARPVGGFGPNDVGAGLVDALGAVTSVALPPTVSITERPPELGRNRRPSIGFAANRPATFACSIDGGGMQPCASPFVPSTPLSEGSHGFVVRATDIAGRSGQSELVSFRIDARAPRTFFRKRPPKTIRTRRRKAKAVFRFGSNEKEVTFICRVDGGLPRFCKPRFVRRYRIGPHVVRVKAQDAAGNVDRTPAVHRFKVKRRR
jgi:subtilisin family serine protease